MNWYKKAQQDTGFGGMYRGDFFQQFVQDWDNAIKNDQIVNAIQYIVMKYYKHRRPPKYFSSFLADKILEQFPVGREKEDDFYTLLNYTIPYEVKEYIFQERPELNSRQRVSDFMNTNQPLRSYDAMRGGTETVPTGNFYIDPRTKKKMFKRSPFINSLYD